MADSTKAEGQMQRAKGAPGLRSAALEAEGRGQKAEDREPQWNTLRCH